MKSNFQILDVMVHCYAGRISESKPGEYDYASMATGLGHMYMNQMKTIFRILDNVLLEPLN